MIFTLLGTLFGHWAVVSASCATGFAVAPDQVTLYTPMGFENKDLPPLVYEAETERENGRFVITYTDPNGAQKEMRFTVRGDRLIDNAGYKYRRCGADSKQVS